MKSPIRPGRRPTLLIGFLAAVAATVLAISPVLADTVVSHHGKTGVGSLNEAIGEVLCNYDPVALTLLSMTIAGPNVYARDVTPQTDHQKVGWQWIVKRTGGGQPAKTITSRIQKGPATDSTPATFNPFLFYLTSTPAATAKFSMSVKLYWYKPNGRTVAGWSIHRVDNYTWATPSFTGTYPAPPCAGRWGGG